jgi:hypothetical protein
MKTRAELLANIEEKRIKNKDLETKVDLVSEYEAGGGGYDPYDNPGICRELPNGADAGRRADRFRMRQRRR